MEKPRTKASLQVTERLVKLGFDPAFAELVGSELNTDFTAKQMLGYLRSMCPQRPEEVADEMLAILALRERCVQRQTAKAAHYPRGGYSFEE